MLIAISAKGTSLESEIDPRFGRCEYLLIIDSSTEQIVKTMQNENISADGGAGSKTAQKVIRENAECVITGNVGPNAFNVLSAAKLKIYTGAAGTVKQALARFKNNELSETQTNTVRGHH